MPKVIEDLKERILKQVRLYLKQNNTANFSLRQLAKDCDIALGTIYNYFPNKEHLLATVMLEDWQIVLETINQKIKQSDTALNGFLEISEQLNNYCQNYEQVWWSSKSSLTTSSFASRHIILRKQLESCLENLSNYFNLNSSPAITKALAEILLAGASHHDLNKEDLTELFCCLYKEEKCQVSRI